MISHYALNPTGIFSNTSSRQARQESPSNMFGRSLESNTSTLGASLHSTNEQLYLEQQQALAMLKQAKMSSLQEQLKGAVGTSSRSQLEGLPARLPEGSSSRLAATKPSKQSKKKRSAEALKPSSEDVLLLQKQEQLQNVLRQNHREVMAKAAMGLIANTTANQGSKKMRTPHSPVESYTSKSRLSELLLLQQQHKVQSSPVSIMEPMLHRNLISSPEEEKLATFLKLQQENDLRQEMLQNYSRQDLYGSMYKKIQEVKEDRQRQIEMLTEHENLLILLKQKQEEEQHQTFQENLRQKQLYSFLQQHQLEEQQRELQLRMATLEKIQQIHSEDRRNRSRTF